MPWVFAQEFHNPRSFMGCDLPCRITRIWGLCVSFAEQLHPLQLSDVCRVSDPFSHPNLESCPGLCRAGNLSSARGRCPACSGLPAAAGLTLNSGLREENPSPTGRKGSAGAAWRSAGPPGGGDGNPRAGGKAGRVVGDTLGEQGQCWNNPWRKGDSGVTSSLYSS